MKTKERMMKRFVCKLIAVLLTLTLIPWFAPRSDAASSADTIAKAIKVLASQAPFKGAGYSSFNTSTMSGCYAFVYTFSKYLFGVGIPSQKRTSSVTVTDTVQSGKYKGKEVTVTKRYYTQMQNLGNWSSVGSGSTNSAVLALLKKAQPGDIVQYSSSGTDTDAAAKIRAGTSGWTADKVYYATHVMMVYSVSDSGITFIHDTSSKGVVTKYAKWANVTGSGSALGSFAKSDYALSMYRCSKNVVTQKVTFNAAGGSVSTASKNVTIGSTYGTLPTPTRSGYLFTGWFTAKSGGTHVTSSTTVKITKAQTLYAQWKIASVDLIGQYNLSDKNYFYGSDFSTLNNTYWKSRDTSVSTISVDGSVTHDGYNSLKIVNASAGASGKDLAFYTLTNANVENSGYVGDSKTMTLSFWAKASSSGAKIYFRWGYEGSYRSVTLTNAWQKYTVRMDKTTSYGNWIHPYIDRAGTVWLCELQLEDGASSSEFVPENGYMSTTSNVTGGKYTLPAAPARSGYEFIGWYTSKTGGTQITSDTAVKSGNMMVYAHWASTSAGITRQPADVVTTTGGVASFSVTATGSGLKYSWQVSADGGVSWNDLDPASFPGAASSSLSFTTSYEMEGNQYRCSVTDGEGNVAVSSAALLILRDSFVKIVEQDTEVCSYGYDLSDYDSDWNTITIHFIVGGDEPYLSLVKGNDRTVTYNCIQYGVDSPNNNNKVIAQDVYTDAHGYLHVTATIRNFTGQNVFCSFGCSNPNYGYYSSDPIAVRYVVGFDTEPQDTAAVAGDEVSLNCLTYGDRSYKSAYRWQVSEDGGNTWAEIDSDEYSGADTSTLTFTATEEMNGFEYRCVATDERGAATSAAAGLTVKDSPIDIVSQPSDSCVKDGDAASFSVEAVSESSLSYRWQTSDGGDAWRDVGSAAAGSDTNTLSFEADSEMDGSLYRCVITDADGRYVVSLTGRLSVTGIAHQPEDAAVSPGETATFAVVMTGVGEDSDVTYRWQVSSDGGDTWSDLDTGEYPDAADDSVSVTAGDDNDGNLYRCIIVDESGNVFTTDPAKLTVTVALKGDVDRNGAVNMKDVLLLRRAVSGAVDLDEKEAASADVNGDGAINMKDVLMLRRILAGDE